MTPVVKVQDVVDEMDLLSDEHRAYLNRKTGELVTLTNEEIQAVEEDYDLAGYPDWQEVIEKARQVLNSDDYLQFPSRFDLHEYSIMERFCSEIGDADLSNELFSNSRFRGLSAFQTCASPI
jgi:hypothetical protein